MIVLLHDTHGRIKQMLHEPIPSDYLAILDEKGTRYHVEGTLGDAHDPVAILNRQYVKVTTELLDRPQMEAIVDRLAIAADGQDEARLTGLPVPCDVTIEGPDGRETVTVEDGEIVLTADVAATYRISAARWPYLPWSAEVIAS